MEEGPYFSAPDILYKVEGSYKWTAVQRSTGCNSGGGAVTCQSGWVDSRFHVKRVLEQDTEPQVAYQCIHRCMNVCECLEESNV